jgi:glycosyltransferase involved in cell wall biosynthesis
MTAPVLPVVVAPTYNNGRSIADILSRIEITNLPIIVVNDGSTDSTSKILADWQSPTHTVLTHPSNRGKSAALRTAFKHALQAGFTHAVTIDTDGQLAPEDIAPLLFLAQQSPSALIIGERDVTAADYPARSRWGRRISNLLIRLESGACVADSQCGLRVYPLVLVDSIPCHSEFFGFETEIITRAAWAGVPFLGTAVSCRYLPPGEQVSHFKPWLDSLRSLRMHARLLTAALNPLPLPAGIGPFASIRRRILWRRFMHCINPVSAWRAVRNDAPSRTRFAAGFATGVFIGNLPLYGVQTLLCLFIARRLKLHPVSVVAGSNIAFPPVGPLLIAGAITVGHLLLHGSLPLVADYTLAHFGIAGFLWPVLLDWIVGGIVLGAVLAAISFIGLDFVLRAAASAGGWVPAEAAKGVE